MLFLILSTLIITSAVNAILAARRSQRSINEQLQGVAQTLAESRFPLTRNVLRQMQGLTGALFAVTNDRGEMQAASFSADDRLPDVTAVDQVDLSNASTRVVEGLPYYHVTLKLDRRLAGFPQKETLHIFYPRARYQAAWRDAVFPPLAMGGLATLLCLAFSVQVARRVSRSIDSFRAGIHKLTHGEFQPLPIPARNDEVRDLVLSTNQLAETLARYENEVRTSERLQTLGQLGAGMAHQLRNAVTGCQLALDLHRQDCQAEDDESLQVANQQLALMEEYLTRFLDAGRSRSRASESLDLRTVLDEALALTRPMASHAKVELNSQTPTNEARLQGDRHTLCQMLVNVIINGIEACTRYRSIQRNMAQGRSLIGWKPAVHVDLSQPEPGVWQFEIVDTGEGPQADIQHRLFEPLSTDKPEGTGLGLSVAAEIAKAHRGSITWHRRDATTSFVIRLAGDVANGDTIEVCDSNL